jgi:hypothetical protein
MEANEYFIEQQNQDGAPQQPDAKTGFARPGGIDQVRHSEEDHRDLIFSKTKTG